MIKIWIRKPEITLTMDQENFEKLRIKHRQDILCFQRLSEETPARDIYCSGCNKVAPIATAAAHRLH
jgi:hypothetical protein